MKLDHHHHHYHHHHHHHHHQTIISMHMKLKIAKFKREDFD